jgi:8-amino-7-oxononanoate synthase
MLTLQLQTKKAQYKKLHLLRQRTSIADRTENIIEIGNARLVNFSSNDYLGIVTDLQIKQAFKAGVDRYGFGGTASALICGYLKVHQELEERFAEFLGRDAAILFNSGYLANLGVLTTLAGKNTAIFSDKLCHASLLDAIALSKAKHYRYAHNDVTHLKFRMADINSAHKIIVTDSVFSMEGDIADLKAITNHAQQSKATLLVDDAHGIGILGKNGGGICELYALSQKQVPILITPLGKAFGSLGAIVSGSKELIDVLLQFARSYIYTTAMPPAIAYALLVILHIVKTEYWRRERLMDLIQFFINEARRRNLPVQSHAETPIKSIIIGDNCQAVALQQLLRDRGFWVYAIRPPTVPPNTARLRISLNCLHTEQQIIDLLDFLAEYLH